MCQYKNKPTCYKVFPLRKAMAVVLEFMRQEIVKRVSDDLCLLTKQDTKDRKKVKHLSKKYRGINCDNLENKSEKVEEKLQL
jgi:hypothetical protein